VCIIRYQFHSNPATNCCIYSTSWWWVKKCSKHVQAVNCNELKANGASCWPHYTDVWEYIHLRVQFGSHFGLTVGTHRVPAMPRCIYCWLCMYHQRQNLVEMWKPPKAPMIRWKKYPTRGIAPLPPWRSIINLQEPCVLYKGRAHRYLQHTLFFIFFQQIHVLNFLNTLHTLHFFLFKMPFIS
jgi:hypothetical protein